MTNLSGPREERLEKAAMSREEYVAVQTKDLHALMVAFHRMRHRLVKAELDLRQRNSISRASKDPE